MVRDGLISAAFSALRQGQGESSQQSGAGWVVQQQLGQLSASIFSYAAACADFKVAQLYSGVQQCTHMSHCGMEVFGLQHSVGFAAQLMKAGILEHCFQDCMHPQYSHWALLWYLFGSQGMWHAMITSCQAGHPVVLAAFI